MSLVDLFLTNTQYLTSQDVIDRQKFCQLLVDYCDVFISCLNSHSDGTHSLQMIHCRASDVMQNLSKSVLIKKPINLHFENF